MVPAIAPPRPPPPGWPSIQWSETGARAAVRLRVVQLHEFATLVRDLQQYAAFDTNCDGAIDCDELYDALQALGVRSGRDEVIQVFEAIVRVAPPSMSFKGGAATDKEAGLSMNVFTNVRAQE